MRHTVTDHDTAASLGSGDLAVLGTPRLLAWMEAATMEAAAGLLAPGQTTVGTAVRIRHRRPTPVGGTVTVTAEPSDGGEDGHLTFTVRATDESGQVIGDGEVDRVIVDRARFLSRHDR